MIDSRNSFVIHLAVNDLLTTIESKLISLASQSNNWANILAQVIFDMNESGMFDILL